MESKYQLNDKVEYIATEVIKAFGFRKTTRFHRVGYIKRIKKTLTGFRYWIVQAHRGDNTGRLDILRESDIIGKFSFIKPRQDN